MEKDPVKGNPVKEQFLLILADIECLVQLREKVIDEVAKFFYYFSFKKLAELQIDDSYFGKEELVLSWAEAESTGVALQRRKYILLKYRELLIRKFLEARQMNFSPGDGSSAVDLNILDWLTDLHLFVLEELKDQSLAHGLRWEKTCCSKIFEGRTRDRGAVIARSNTNTKSSCWIRTMLRVDGTWVIEPCADYWKPIPREVSSSPVVIPSRLSYVDTLPPVSEFFKVITKRWSDVCLEVIKFFASRRLLPVGSVNFCRALSVVEPVNSFVLHQPTVFSLRLSQFCTVFSRYSLFSMLCTEDIRGFVASIASARTALRSVQTTSSAASPHILSVADTDFVAQRVPMVLDQRPFSSSSSDEYIHFDDHDTAATAFSLPAAATPDLTEVLAQLRASIEQIRDRVDDAKLKDTILLHLHGIEQRFTARLDDQDRVLGALRKDSHNKKKLLSLDIKSSQKQLSAQAAAAAFDTVDVRRVVKELDAKVTYLDGHVAATHNDLLEFRATAQETLNHIADQLSELIAYINRGGNDKKGEVSSSRPQPPPDDQNRGSGNATTHNDLLEFRATAQETLNHIADQLSELIAYINRGGNDKKGEVSSSRPQPPPDDQNRGSGNASGGGDNVRTTDFVEIFPSSVYREGRSRGRSGGRRSSGSKRKYSSSAAVALFKGNQQIATVLLNQPLRYTGRYFKRSADAYLRVLKQSAVVFFQMFKSSAVAQTMD
ncbi:hypothetical protein F511_19515 [Dorcoceras hygrometricum]|uniref:Uncharacterized protein n=1 Tax=Dorcoceras hygrometricum TaxID=472368 RepID=A0A2Z7B3N1_9LAMI|nr:hypothetical protein F511_19515 [Dorcoceras hygrometricum]